MNALQLVGLAVLLAAAIGIWSFFRSPAPASVPPPHPPIEPPPPAARWPEPTLELRSWQDLLAQTGTDAPIAATRSASGLNAATWDNYLLPVLQHVADLVQLLPASEGHHHAQPGGLWIHTCETLSNAVRLRLGVMLPPGRDADDQARHRHRWTAGIVIAAMLHDIGKPVADLRVRLYGPNHHAAPWNAMAGSFRDLGATHYAVDFPPEGERDYRAHQRLGALLLQRLVPSPTLAWIGEDRELLDALMSYLAGESKDNPIAGIVSRAERESVAVNLRSGPRTRFVTARTVPLIERLMRALRQMLAEGGHLPLNRPGAAGFVFGGDVWFAAARLANAVRAYLAANESSGGIPGEDKNDRLFDAWQDYGACRTNPRNARALWGARIEFGDPDAGGFTLPAMLRFPLETLYAAPEQYPLAMAGRIVPLDEAESRKAEPPPETVEPKPEAGSEIPGTAAAGINEALPGKQNSSEQKAEAPEDPEFSLSFSPPAQDREFLDDEDIATAAMLQPAKRKPAPAPALKPVSPASAVPRKSDSKAKAPSTAAVEFMAWVQQGVAGGVLSYNTTGSMVHFVLYGEAPGVLLVSPSIFRHYAAETTERDVRENDAPGQAAQRAFSNAGWHVRSAGKNITSYQVMRAGRQGGNLLNGFLLLDPERFFNPLPPPNDRLVLWNPSSKKEKSDGVSFGSETATAR